MNIEAYSLISIHCLTFDEIHVVVGAEECSVDVVWYSRQLGRDRGATSVDPVHALINRAALQTAAFKSHNSSHSPAKWSDTINYVVPTTLFPQTEAV